MNHVRESKLLTAWFTITQLWTRLIDQPAKNAVDALHFEKEKLLTRIFLGNYIGSRIYNRTDANWWTMLRLKTCWIPPLLIVFGLNLAACATSIPIWSTDLIDGWFARTKQQDSDEGMRRETTVDTIYKLLLFIAVFIRYADMRVLVGTAGLLELIRIGGAKYFISKGHKPKTNRSGRWKTPCYVAGIGILLLYPCNAVHLFIEAGIALSIYSMFMHYQSFRTWLRSRT